MVLGLLVFGACSSSESNVAPPTLLDGQVREAWPAVRDAAPSQVLTVGETSDCTPNAVIWYLPDGDRWVPELVGGPEGPYEPYSVDAEYSTPADCGVGAWDLLVPDLRGSTLVCGLVDQGCMRVEIRL